MSGVLAMVGVAALGWVVAVAVKAVVARDYISNFETDHRHLTAENQRRFVLWTAPATLLAVAVSVTLAATGSFLSAGWLGGVAVVGAVLVHVVTAAVPFRVAFHLGFGLSAAVGFLAELTAFVVLMAVALVFGIMGPIGLLATLALAVGIRLWSDRADEKARKRLDETAHRPVAPSTPPPAPSTGAGTTAQPAEPAPA